MLKVKYSKIGLIDMIYFKDKYKGREKMIESAPDTPLVSEYETNIKAEERHPEKQIFIIDKIVKEDDDVKTYFLRRKDAKLPAFFRAGQYVTVRQMINGKLIARPISISCGPDYSLEGYYTITVKKVPNGFFSDYVFDNWKVGDEVVTSGPQGTFFYEGIRDTKKVVAVAGGSGITPLLSMAYAIEAGDEDFDLTILYGSKTVKDILFKKQFEAICKATKKVHVVYVLSDEEKEGYEHGFIDANLLKKYLPKGEKTSIFASGPQAMYRFLDKEVEKLGIEKKYYRQEVFGSTKEPWLEKGYPMDCKDKVFKLHIKMCDKEYDIPCSANENILVAMERAGIAGPNRCRVGICGYCRSKLVSGKVFIPELTDGRRQADKVFGYIHPCVSFAISDLSIEVPFNK